MAQTGLQFKSKNEQQRIRRNAKRQHSYAHPRWTNLSYEERKAEHLRDFPNLIEETSGVMNFLSKLGFKLPLRNVSGGQR